MFQLPANFAADVGSSTTGVLSALSPITTLVIGVLLAVFAIGAIISWIRH